MLRSFDHAGYYETRLLLMIVALAIAIAFAIRKRDYRYLVIFASGVVFQAWMEYSLQWRGMRGASYSLSIFGASLPSAVRPLFQGFAEGGVLSLMAFWFLDLKADRPPDLPDLARWRGYFVMSALIVALAAVVGWMSVGRPISSPRPMFSTTSLINTSGYLLLSVLLCWWKGGLRYLGYFFFGLMIYVVLTFGTLQLFGARYIGVIGVEGQMTAASPPLQIGVMFLSHLWEVAGGKVHYFAIPFALGLLRFRENRR